MTELKTLKDFDFTLVDENGEYEGLRDELKQEAIKWIKKEEERREFREHKGYSTSECNCIINWIKHFFNITEEDLK